MANEKQFKLNTKIFAVRGVYEYRLTIPALVNQNDRILEVGCEWGTTSRMLHEQCQNLIATDISAKVLLKAKNINPEINFKVLDIYDVKSAMALNFDFNKMYVDVSGFSGYKSVLDVLSILNMYSTVFELDLIVVKSGALKQLFRNGVAWKE